MVQIEIQRQVVQYSTALAGDVDAGTVSTLLNHFSNELDNVLKAFKDIWSTRLEIQLLGSKLYLFSLCLTVASKRHGLVDGPKQSYAFTAAQLPVQLGLPSAVSLIHNVSMLNRDSSADTYQHGTGMIHYPKFYFRLVVFAVVFLMKFLSANPKAAQEDRDLAISHITTAHQFFSSFSPAEDFMRVAEVIEVLAKNLREDSDDTSAPTRSRLGASLLYDTVKRHNRPLEQSRPANHDFNIGAINDAMGRQDDVSKTVSVDTSGAGASLWVAPEAYTNLSGFQPVLDESFEGFPWMSDEILSEMFRM